MNLTPGNKLPLYLEELNRLKVELLNLNKKKKTRGVINQIRSLSGRVSSLRSRANSLGKRFNIICIQFKYFGDAWEVMLTDISLDDAKKVFEAFLLHNLDSPKITDINYIELKPLELRKIS